MVTKSTQASSVSAMQFRMLLSQSLRHTQKSRQVSSHENYATCLRSERRNCLSEEEGKRRSCSSFIFIPMASDAREALLLGAGGALFSSLDYEQSAPWDTVTSGLSARKASAGRTTRVTGGWQPLQDLFSNDKTGQALQRFLDIQLKECLGRSAVRNQAGAQRFSQPARSNCFFFLLRDSASCFQMLVAS